MITQELVDSYMECYKDEYSGMSLEDIAGDIIEEHNSYCEHDDEFTTHQLAHELIPMIKDWMMRNDTGQNRADGIWDEYR
jgi:hypothetical protein